MDHRLLQLDLTFYDLSLDEDTDGDTGGTKDIQTDDSASNNSSDDDDSGDDVDEIVPTPVTVPAAVVPYVSHSKVRQCLTALFSP